MEAHIGYSRRASLRLAVWAVECAAVFTILVTYEWHASLTTEGMRDTAPDLSVSFVQTVLLAPFIFCFSFACVCGPFTQVYSNLHGN